jgi:hypothetical protein
MRICGWVSGGIGAVKNIFYVRCCAFGMVWVFVGMMDMTMRAGRWIGGYWIRTASVGKSVWETLNTDYPLEVLHAIYYGDLS